MATYTTTSEFTDLAGSMVVTNNNVDSYTSSTQGAGTVTNLGGKDTLEFSVFFAKDGRTYTIDATANGGGNGFAGEANDGSPAGGEEPWAATVSSEETVTQKAAY
jgi:hypothetical protein